MPPSKCRGADGALHTNKPAPIRDTLADERLDFNLGSSNTHPAATSFIVTELGVPLSKGEGEGRINDCLHELFSTLCHFGRKDARQLRPRKNINIPLLIHRLFFHSSNSKVHEKEQSILYLT